MLEHTLLQLTWPSTIVLGAAAVACAVVLLVLCTDNAERDSPPTVSQLNNRDDRAPPPDVVVNNEARDPSEGFYLTPTQDEQSRPENNAETRSGYVNVSLSQPIPVHHSGSDVQIHTYLNAAAANTRFQPVKFNINKCLGGTLKKQITPHIVDSKHLDLIEVIGKGAFGLVFKGTFRTDKEKDLQLVAVKTVHGDECSPADMKSFLEEVVRMVGFNHENVQTTIGLCFKGSQPYAVMPFMEYGDLRSFIISPDRDLTIRRLLEFGLQIAKGMQYLHNLKFVHRDLAARNCMINSHMVIKVADFGLSRDIFTSDYYRMKDDNPTPLPVRWMAPESLEKRVFTMKSDVWSFGVVMWELLTRGRTPYPKMPSLKVMEYVKRGGKLERLDGFPSQIFNMMEKCWMKNPSHRPSFGTLTSHIHTVLGTNR